MVRRRMIVSVFLSIVEYDVDDDGVEEEEEEEDDDQRQVGLGLAVFGTSIHLLFAMNNLNNIGCAHCLLEGAVVHAHFHLGSDRNSGFGGVDNSVVAGRADE